MQSKYFRQAAAIALAGGALALHVAPAFSQGAASSARSGSYPVKPVRIVDSFPPGGGSDVVARLLTPKLTEAWGQQVFVENRGGANGIIGNEYVLRSAPDGYTVLIATGSYAANPSVHKISYDPINDITVLGQVAATIFMVVVHPTLPVKNSSRAPTTWPASGALTGRPSGLRKSAPECGLRGSPLKTLRVPKRLLAGSGTGRTNDVCHRRSGAELANTRSRKAESASIRAIVAGGGLT